MASIGSIEAEMRSRKQQRYGELMRDLQDLYHRRAPLDEEIAHQEMRAKEMLAADPWLKDVDWR